MKDLHYEILNELFENVNEKSFEYKDKDKEYEINYSVYYNKDVNMFKLILSLDEDDNDNVNSDISAEILEKIDKLIRKGPVRKNYNIIISHDEVSEYYSNNIHKFLNRFERKLRELLYIIMVKTYGVEWYRKTVMVNDELHGNVKKTAKCNKDITTELIENALQNMTLHDLELYLFNSYSESNFNELFNKDSFDESLLNSKSKEDIVSMISACIPKSLWERFFKDIVDAGDIEKRLEEIRNYRNKVAHCKDFYKDDYISCKNVLEELVSKIDLAIEEIETKEFDLENIKESRDAYSSFDSIQKAIEMTDLRKQITNLPKQIAESLKAVERPNSWKQMEELLKAAERPNLSKQMEESLKAVERSNLPKQMAESLKAVERSNLPKQIAESLKAAERPNLSKQMAESLKAVERSNLPKQIAESLKAAERSIEVKKSQNEEKECE